MDDLVSQLTEALDAEAGPISADEVFARWPRSQVAAHGTNPFRRSSRTTGFRRPTPARAWIWAAAVVVAGAAVVTGVGLTSSTQHHPAPSTGPSTRSDWVVEQPARPPRSSGDILEFEGVSCPSATECTAVGFWEKAFSGTTLAERWNGGPHWLIEPTPAIPRLLPQLDGVSCPTPTWCMAVGVIDNVAGSGATGYYSLSLAENWSHGSWRLAEPPRPAGLPMISAPLTSVSCTSTTFCMAVGRHGSRGEPDKALAEVWDGRTWTIVGVPQPSRGEGSAFDSVSCTAPSSCTAVGDYPVGQTRVPLLETWDGRRWSLSSRFVVTGSDGTLEGVSCVAPSTVPELPRGAGVTCMAVGYTGGSAVLRNGPNTRLIDLPVPHGALNTRVTSVSCVSPTSCIVVGWFAYRMTGSLRSRPLVEVWHSGRWAIEATPSLPVLNRLGGVGWFLAVSCPESSIGPGQRGTCTAVGLQQGSDTAPQLLAERQRPAPQASY